MAALRTKLPSVEYKIGAGRTEEIPLRVSTFQLISLHYLTLR